jgi:hypothetical protein
VAKEVNQSSVISQCALEQLIQRYEMTGVPYLRILTTRSRPSFSLGKMVWNIIRRNSWRKAGTWEGTSRQNCWIASSSVSRSMASRRMAGTTASQMESSTSHWRSVKSSPSRGLSGTESGSSFIIFNSVQFLGNQSTYLGIRGKKTKDHNMNKWEAMWQSEGR